MKQRLTLMIAAVAVLGLLPSIASAHDDGEVRSRATATGGQESPPNDSDMIARVKIKIDDGELEFRVKVKDNSGTIVASHIHCAAPGVNGSVGVNLGVAAPFTDEKGTLVRGDISGAFAPNGCGWTSPADVAAAIEAGAAYVNVHTLLIPGGEIRADLSPR